MFFNPFFCVSEKKVKRYYSKKSLIEKFPLIDISKLEKDKLFIYHSDKQSLAYVFNSVAEVAKYLTPKRVAHLSDLDLNQNQNLQHIRRVINKGTLTQTEKGEFYIFKNPNHSFCLDIVPWGVNLTSTAGTKLNTKQEREMVNMPSFQFYVVVGIILSDGYLGSSNRSINKFLYFKQSLSKSAYVWHVFSILSHYCAGFPKLVMGNRNGVKFYGLDFHTRSYPMFTELYKLFYPKGIKLIPDNIYDLLSPVALAHLIMGDGSSREYGLEICTDSYSLIDVIKITNVLIIKYQLICTVRLKKENQYRIYVSSKSMDKLRTIVNPYMHPSMVYKIKNQKLNI